ncbi:unnamed protein product [Leptidea sinapis]|uniref:Uncharacterized protein n=1 Tax=Leptidea sinapis TaxID=189913 RepID=A0A5E4QDV5_9NEOP|nr:unnamed protein product [Leptidea sinapis]
MSKKLENNSNSNTVEGCNNKSSKIIKGILMNLLKQFFFYLRMLFDMTVDFVYGLYWDGRRKTIPPLEKKHAILKESAVRLASMIRNKELKSEDLVCACIERIKLRYEDAIKDARAVDKMIENGLTEEEFTKKPFLVMQ